MSQFAPIEGLPVEANDLSALVTGMNRPMPGGRSLPQLVRLQGSRQSLVAYAIRWTGIGTRRFLCALPSRVSFSGLKSGREHSDDQTPTFIVETHTSRRREAAVERHLEGLLVGSIRTDFRQKDN
jgi:hypothetical protein